MCAWLKLATTVGLEIKSILYLAAHAMQMCAVLSVFLDYSSEQGLKSCNFFFYRNGERAEQAIGMGSKLLKL